MGGWVGVVLATVFFKKLGLPLLLLEDLMLLEDYLYYNRAGRFPIFPGH